MTPPASRATAPAMITPSAYFASTATCAHASSPGSRTPVVSCSEVQVSSSSAVVTRDHDEEPDGTGWTGDALRCSQEASNSTRSPPPVRSSVAKLSLTLHRGRSATRSRTWRAVTQRSITTASECSGGGGVLDHHRPSSRVDATPCSAHRSPYHPRFASTATRSRGSLTSCGGFEGSGHHVERLGEQSVGRDERRQEAQHVAVGSADQCHHALGVAVRGHRAGSARVRGVAVVADELDRHHRAAATDVTDTGVLLGDRGEPLGDELADLPGPGGKGLLSHRGDGAEARGTGARRTAVGATETTDVHGVHDLRTTGRRGERQTARDALRSRDQVWDHALVV